MIKRYTNPEMGAIWSEQRRYESWLQVEVAAAEVDACSTTVHAGITCELVDGDRIEDRAA